MTTGRRILGVLLTAGGGFVLLAGILSSFVGICGPAPDAWQVFGAGGIGVALGLWLFLPTLPVKPPLLKEFRPKA